MKIKPVSFVLLSVLSTTCNAFCEADATRLSASYEMTLSSHDGKTISQRQLILWREGSNTLAYQYPELRLSERWDRVKENVIKPTRYFDAYQRAIEYQPWEHIRGSQPVDWETQYQLISTEMMSKLTRTTVSGEDCERTELLSGNINGQHVELKWQPAYSLPARLKVTTDNATITWARTALEQTPSEIQAFFSTRDAFQATDFADIGDDHTDPFLTNMVSQGFIEAPASGFYTSEGHAIEGTHIH